MLKSKSPLFYTFEKKYIDVNLCFNDLVKMKITRGWNLKYDNIDIALVQRKVNILKYFGAFEGYQLSVISLEYQVGPVLITGLNRVSRNICAGSMSQTLYRENTSIKATRFPWHY